MSTFPSRRAAVVALTLLCSLLMAAALLAGEPAPGGAILEPGQTTSNPQRPDIPYQLEGAAANELVARRGQASGLIAVHAQSGPWVTTTDSSWTDMPQMRGRVTIKETSTLALTLCAETQVLYDKPVFARVLLNGQVADPSDVLFAVASGLETNCFTFVKENAPPDIYAVRAQWRVDSGGLGAVGDRTLTIAYAAADAPEMRLLAHAAPSGPDVTHSGGWVDVPDMQGTIDMPYMGDLAITFSAEANATPGKRLYVRAVVDGAPAAPSDQILTTDSYRGTRAMHFVLRDVSAGPHQVRLQWSVDGGTGYLGDRTLSVVGVTYSPPHRASSFVVSPPSGPDKAIPGRGAWYDIPDLSGLIYVPVEGDVAIRFSAEVAVDSDSLLGLRALVDDTTVSPSDVVLSETTGHMAYAYTFVKRNLARGYHTVRLQWLVSGSGLAYIGDRTLAAIATAEQVPVLFVAMESNRGAPDYAYGGLFAPKVIDAGAGARRFKGYVRERLAGDAPSVADYFRESSDDRYFLTEAAVLGPYLKYYDEKYYREHVPNPFTEMKLEALDKADAFFDYSLYDHDGDGVVRRDELLVAIIFYQDDHFGEVNSIPDFWAASEGVWLSGADIATIYTPDFDLPEEIGVFAHELAHAGFGAGDMYESGWEPTAPGPYSLMDQHYAHPHLDPLHKIRAADWFDPFVVTADGYYIVTAAELPGGYSSAWKLGHPTAHAGEYFLVENRAQIGYDAYLPDAGLAIWHIDETVGADDFWRKAVEIEPASGYVDPNPYDAYLFDGTGHPWGQEFTNTTPLINSRWHDGSFSEIGLYAISSAGDTMWAYFDVPGPGVLVDLLPETAYGHENGRFPGAPDQHRHGRRRVQPEHEPARRLGHLRRKSGGAAIL